MTDCGIQPMEYNVIVKPDVVEEKTAGGLYIPEDKKEKDEFAQTIGTLIAVSPMAFAFADWPDGARKPQVADRVIFSRYQATEVKGQDGKKYWLMKDRVIAGVML